MKVLAGRTETAQALNFGKYPVLNIDLDNEERIERNDGSVERYCKGCDVKVEYEGNHGTLTTRGQIYYDFLENENIIEDGFKISASGACLHASFGYEDVMEDLRWAKATTVKAGQEVALLVTSAKLKMFFVLIGKVSDRIDPFCITCATIE